MRTHPSCLEVPFGDQPIPEGIIIIILSADALGSDGGAADGGRQAGSLIQLLRDLAAEGLIALAPDEARVAPHGVGGFEVLDTGAFQRCARHPQGGDDYQCEGRCDSDGGGGAHSGVINVI